VYEGKLAPEKVESTIVAPGMLADRGSKQLECRLCTASLGNSQSTEKGVGATHGISSLWGVDICI
jgi:hypothetical protein